MLFVTSVDCMRRCGGTAWVTYPSPLKDGGEVGHGLEATRLSDFFKLRRCRQQQTRMGQPLLAHIISKGAAHQQTKSFAQMAFADEYRLVDRIK